MSISQVNPHPVSVRAAMAVAALRSHSTTTANVQTTGPARQADTVQLSSTAKALSAAKLSVDGASEVRDDRIAALKSAIANGTYAVESRDLARSMVRRSLSA